MADGDNELCEDDHPTITQELEVILIELCSYMGRFLPS